MVARLEHRDSGADRIDDPGGIVAQDLGLALGRPGTLAHLVIDRIGGDRPDGDADVAAFRFRLCGLEIDQGIGGLDGKGLPVSDGLHLAVLLRDCGHTKPAFPATCCRTAGIARFERNAGPIAKSNQVHNRPG